MNLTRLENKTGMLYKQFHRISQEQWVHFLCNGQGMVPKNIKDIAAK